MIIKKMSDMVRGWFIGDFVPCAYSTKDFEVGIHHHTKGQVCKEHYHKISTEINVLLKGKMSMNGIHINEGDIFIIEPNESTVPEFYEDCIVICVKTPSAIGDKYETVRE